MNWKVPLLPAAFACCLGVLMTVSASLHANDFCSDVPTCTDGKALTLITMDNRLDCAMFKCKDSSAVAPEDKVINSEAELKDVFATDTSVQCNNDRVRVNAQNLNGASHWTCAPKASTDCSKQTCIASPVVVADVDVGVADNDTDTKESSDSDMSFKCDDDKTLVRLRSQNINGIYKWTCILKSSYVHMQRNGSLMEDVQLATNIPSSKDMCQDDEALVRIAARQRTPIPVWSCIKKSMVVWHKQNGSIRDDMLVTNRPKDMTCEGGRLPTQTAYINEDGIRVGRWSCTNISGYNGRNPFETRR